MADQRPQDRPVRRAYHVYLYAVCLASVVVILFATASALFGIVRVAAPGTTANAGISTPFSAFGGDVSRGGEDAERDAGVVQLIENGILAAVAGGLFALHWGRAEGLRRELASAARAPARSGSRSEGERRPTRRPRGERPPKRRDEE